MHLDNLIEDIGSFGKFQLIMLVVVMTPKLGIGYNMMIMAYGSLIPDWWCIKQGETIFNMTNSSYQHCEASPESSNSSCQRVYDPTISTVVSEWDLVCERKWITPSISSIQMGGVLLGALIGGQCAETFGRKKTYYTTLASQAALTILIIFSDSWYIYAFMRFLIGVSLGSYLVVCVFLVEFINYKYRPVLTAVPFWATGVCFLSLSTWLLRSWQYVHVAVGVFTLPFLLGWFIVPESVRWLAVKGRIKEAEEVVERIAKWNGRAKPPNATSVLQAVMEEEQQRTKGGKQYTYLDLYRFSFAKHTIIVHIVWWCISTSYYGFSFGVGKFTGDFYLNQFFMYILEFPLFLPTIILMNKYGRRILTIVNFVAGAACCVLVVIIQNTVFSNTGGTVITVLSLACKLFASQAWAALIVLTNESYPTVVRNLGYGAANTAARIGGIAAPFIFSLTDNKMIPYIVTAFLLGGSGVMTFFWLPETLGTALEDIIGEKKIQETKINTEIDDKNDTVSSLVNDKTDTRV
ncbi:hypothetical protein LOTGIDRAFT_239057 [Lottia gigantea]|uniref:Major facilitator superfamily (MFS) profile domain-containing protein n=1 Tax=Lottia gigantea TaxID=225164 RepID=V4AMT4_LOTGI|nr:hypothetical protein LOTGIDRAFT_239057 [Lottia gigantea]ESO98457.1 hypothetical protein LOTGIDRAFT_239057 [Lottia gigantea]